MMQDASRATAPTLSLRQLADLHDRHASKYYRRRDGSPTREHMNIRAVVDRFVAFAGEASPASKINRHQVRAWMDQLAADDLSRNYVNACLRKLRTVARWAADLDYIPTSIIEDLRLVKSLQPGRSAARESHRAPPPPLSIWEQLRPHLQPWARDVIQLVKLTGARPSEILELTNADVHVDQLARLCPAQHKSAHRGKARVIPLSPSAIAILDRHLRPLCPLDFVFASARSEKGHYTIDGLRSAVARAARKAGVAPPRLYDARRRVAIEARTRMGLDAAQALLGHAHASTTEIYAPLPAGDQRTYDAARRAQEAIQ